MSNTRRGKVPKRQIPKREPEKKRDWWALLGSIMAILGWGLIIVYYIWIMFLKPPPLQIVNIQVTPGTVQTGQTASIRVFTTGGSKINYIYRAVSGTIGKQPDPFQRYEDKATYVAPGLPGGDVITVIVYDEKGEEDKDFCIVTIVEAERIESP